MGDDREDNVMAPSNFNEHMDNAIRHITNMMQVKSLDKAASVQDLEKLQGYLPVGKDLVLSDLSKDFDRALYTEYHQLLTNLITMQKAYKVKNTSAVNDGILPGIESVFYYFLYFIIGTRACGPQRERMVQADPKHSLNQVNGMGKLFNNQGA